MFFEYLLILLCKLDAILCYLKTLKIRHVTRVADANEDALESLYEKRLRKKLENDNGKERNTLEVDPVDALPIKTLDGQIVYQRGVFNFCFS